MPFDGTNFPPAEGGKRRDTRGDNFVTGFILVVVFLLLALPISLAGMVDVLKYLGGR